MNDRTDLEELKEMMTDKTIGYRWAKARLGVNEWWHHHGLEYTMMAVALITFALLIWWGNTVGINRMEG